MEELREFIIGTCHRMAQYCDNLEDASKYRTLIDIMNTYGGFTELELEHISVIVHDYCKIDFGYPEDFNFDEYIKILKSYLKDAFDSRDFVPHLLKIIKNDLGFIRSKCAWIVTEPGTTLYRLVEYYDVCSKLLEWNSKDPDKYRIDSIEDKQHYLKFASMIKLYVY